MKISYGRIILLYFLLFLYDLNTFFTRVLRDWSLFMNQIVLSLITPPSYPTIIFGGHFFSRFDTGHDNAHNTKRTWGHHTAVRYKWWSNTYRVQWVPECTLAETTKDLELVVGRYRGNLRVIINQIILQFHYWKLRFFLVKEFIFVSIFLNIFTGNIIRSVEINNINSSQYRVWYCII